VHVARRVERRVGAGVVVHAAEPGRPLQRRSVRGEAGCEEVDAPLRPGSVRAGRVREVVGSPGRRLPDDHRPRLRVELDVERNLVGLVTAEERGPLERAPAGAQPRHERVAAERAGLLRRADAVGGARRGREVERIRLSRDDRAALRVDRDPARDVAEAAAAA
jgi:hypothetical protein